MLYSLGVFWSVAVKAVLNSEIHTIDIFLLYLINNGTPNFLDFRFTKI